VVEHERRELCVASGRCAYRADDDMLVGVVLGCRHGAHTRDNARGPGEVERPVG